MTDKPARLASERHAIDQAAPQILEQIKDRLTHRHQWIILLEQGHAAWRDIEPHGAAVLADKISRQQKARRRGGPFLSIHIRSLGCGDRI